MNKVGRGRPRQRTTTTIITTASPFLARTVYLPLAISLFLTILPPAVGLFSPFDEKNQPISTDPLAAFGQFVAHSNRMMGSGTHCRHHCSISDPGAQQCWNDTLSFYEHMMVGTLRRTVLAETNRVLWMVHHRNEHPRRLLTRVGLVNDSRRRFAELPRVPLVKDANSWADAPRVFDRISPAIMDNVLPMVDKMLHFYATEQLGDSGAFPSMISADCPRGCERSWSAWRWLFLGSLLLSLLQLALLALLVILLDRREQSVWRLELDSPEFGDNAAVAKEVGRQEERTVSGEQQRHIITMNIV